jgi:hypothetical protein
MDDLTYFQGHHGRPLTFSGYLGPFPMNFHGPMAANSCYPIGPYPPFSPRYLSCTSQGCTLQEMSHTTPGDNPTISRYHLTQVTFYTAPNHRIRSLKASVIISKIFLFTVRKLKHSLFLSKTRHILITVWSGSPTELRNHFKPTLIFNVLSFNDGPNMIL